MRPARRQSERPLPAEGSSWLSRLFATAVIGVTGVVLGLQFWSPNKRAIPVLLAVVVTGIAWQLSLLNGVGVLILALPYPRGTVFGNTNLAFILVLLAIWLLRITLRMSPAPRPTALDVPIIGLTIAYIVSFYNVHDREILASGLRNFELFVGCVMMYYLVVNAIRTPADLERVHGFQIATAITVFLVAIYELNHPGAPLIAGWLDFSKTVGTEFNTHNVRVGSSFHDFELLSEYCATMLLFGSFLFVRAESNTRRTFYGGFLVLALFVLFATVTRGAFIAMGVAVPVLLYQLRRRINFVTLSTLVVGIAASLGLMNFLVSSFTRSGNLFERLNEVHIAGVVPEERSDIWLNAWHRMLIHPIIGQGPTYIDIPGYSFVWPHNVYLYVGNILGFLGLGFFLAILARLLIATRPVTDDLRDPNYARAYLPIAQAQLVLFVFNETKIDYLRNPIYQFEVWLMFAVWAAAARVSETSVEALPASRPERSQRYAAA